MKKNKNEKLYDLKKKSALIAVGLSFFVPGLGHLYLNRFGLAVFYFFFSALLWVLLLGWLVWIFAMFDAYFEVIKQNKILEIELGL